MAINKLKRTKAGKEKAKRFTDLAIANSQIKQDVINLQKVKKKLEYFKHVIVASSNEAIVIQDFKGIIRIWNRAAEKIYGFKEKEMLGKNITRIIAKENRAEAEKNINRIKQGRPTFRSEQIRITKNKKKIFLNITYSPIYETGEIIEVATTGENITAIKKATAALWKRAAELVIANKKLAFENKEKAKRAAELAIANKKLIFENKEKAKRAAELVLSNTILSTQQETSLDGILVVDGKGVILSFNRRFIEIWGILPGVMKSKSDERMLRSISGKLANPREFICKEKYLRETQNKISRDEAVLKDGRIFDCYSAPMFSANKKYYGRVWYYRDVTKEKEVDRAKSEFISVASHQLKTPLAGIKWMSELLLGNKIDPPSDKQSEFLRDIHFSNERMLRLVDNLLNISHIETGKGFTIEKKKTDVINIINEVLKENKQLASDKRVSIIKLPGWPRKLLLHIDGDKIKQVLGNLINNAIKYCNNKGRVEIGHKDQAKEIIFKIKNTGPGIPRKQQKKVFEKFFRADNAVTQEADGTGLGLYIAKVIAEAHGGKLWFESVENKETTFYFSLPLG